MTTDGRPLPPVTELITTRPDSWLGRPVSWLNDAPPAPAFIRAFVLPGQGREVYLFGAKYELAEATVGGRSLGTGHFEEYFVVTGEQGQWRTHRLLQRGRVTFSETSEKKDYVPATNVHGTRGSAPSWKASQAVWPVSAGSPMSFVGQAALVENETTRAFLTWGINVFLFWSEEAGEDRFKIVTQELELQTLDDHYRAEDSARERKAHPKRSRRST